MESAESGDAATMEIWIKDSIDDAGKMKKDISEQVNKSETYSGTLGTSSVLLLGTINSDYLYNAINFRLQKASAGTRTFFHVRLLDVNNQEILQIPIYHAGRLYTDDFYFPAQK